MADWERGAAEPSLEQMAALCRVLDVTSDYLLLGKEPDAPKPVCPRCGRVLEPGTHFCPNCGQDQQRAADKAEYCLVLHDAAFSEETDLVYQICKEGQFWPDFPFTEQSTKEDLARILAKAPRVLFRRLTRKQAVQLWERFPYPARLTIHGDPNGNTPVEKLLRQSGGYPTQAETARASDSHQDSGGMTFGGTVGAVIVGVIAAVLILSIL